MGNKKFLLTIPLFSAMLLASCGETHTHAFSDTYKTNANQHWKECECGEKQDVANHTFGEGTVVTAATCTEDGSMKYVCTECGYEKIEVIQELGHSAGQNPEWQDDNPTYHYHNCVNEGCLEEIDKEDHDWGEGEVTTQPTCHSKGERTYTCSKCGRTKKVEIPATGDHNWNAGEITTPATCTTDGVLTKTCQNQGCTATTTEVITAPGHDYEDKSSDEAYQYSAKGTWKECSVCGEKSNEVVQAEAPWVDFNFDKAGAVTVDGSVTWDAETHQLSTSNYQAYNGVKFALTDLIGEGRLVFDITVQGVSGKWGPNISFFMLDDQNEKLGDVYCFQGNPFNDFDKHPCQFRVSAIEDGTEVTTLSAQDAEFTYRFDFRGYDKAPTYFAVNGATGDSETKDVVIIKSIVAKETVCGHPANEVSMTNETNSSCTEAGYKEYTCTHTECNNVEYREYKDLLEHTASEPITIEGGAYKYQGGGTYTKCTVCDKVLDDSQLVAAPWARTELSAFELQKSGAGTNTGHTPFRTLTDDLVSITGFYNSGLVAQIGEESEGRNIFSITLKPGTWNWGGPDFYIFIRSGATTLNACTQVYNNDGVTNWLNDGGKIYNAKNEEVTKINENEFFTFEIDLGAKLAEGAKITSVTLTTGWSVEDSTNDFANVPTLSVKDLTFKETFCGHPASMIEEKTGVKSHACAATSDAVWCNGCGCAISYSNTVLDEGYEEADLANTYGCRGSSTYYDNPTHIVKDTCTNQMGPMFLVGANVDKFAIEFKVLKLGEGTNKVFIYVNGWNGEAQKDIAWGNRYTLNLAPESFATNHNPSCDNTYHTITNLQGEAITSYAEGDIVVATFDVTALRGAGFYANQFLIGSDGGTVLQLNHLMMHTVTE